MRCPRDNESLRTLQLDWPVVYACPVCDGIWLSHHALKWLVEKYMYGKHEPALLKWDELMPPAGADTIRFPDHEAYFECPEGHGMLMRHRYAWNSKFFIDSCAVCRSVWIDGWEMRALKDHVKPNELHDLTVQVIAQEHRLSEEEFQKIDQLASMANPNSPMGYGSPLVMLYAFASFLACFINDELLMQLGLLKKEEQPKHVKDSI